MKKTEVYVVVDTPKKAKKLKNVLDMFGQKISQETFEIFEYGENSNGYGFGEFPYVMIDDVDGGWSSFQRVYSTKTKVSLKELRNILAREYLKEGDVVILNNSLGNSIIELKAIDGGIIKVKNQLYLDCGERFDCGVETFSESNFIRYATEEEKALLEPKKELEGGKWYAFSWDDTPNDIRGVYLIDKVENYKVWFKYGINVEDNTWSYRDWCSKSHNWRLATAKEVEKALIEEAKRRGFVNGCVGNNSNIHDKKLKDCELFFNNQYEFDEKDNLLRAILDDDITLTVFKDGQWASIIEQDNFTDSDLSIVERLHDTLLDNHGYSLESKLLTDARLLSNKIKSNIK